jgi:two-component system cell cycle response regulator
MDPSRRRQRAEIPPDVIRQRVAELRQRLADIWSAPDAYLLDAGTDAELLIARVRLALTTLLLAIPLANLIVARPEERLTHLTGLGVTLVAVLIALLAYQVVQQGNRQPWLPLATSLMDVTLVSTALVGFSLIGDPHQAVNSKVTFETYFLAIGATCLRYDLRVSVIAGGVAILEYIGVIALVTLAHDLDSPLYSPWVYGRFFWSDQISRIILLVLHTALCSGIVLRLQRHRRLSNTDRLTGLYNRAYFEDFLTAEVRRSRRYDRPFAVAMVDIDWFKNFNDNFGHAAGDRALRAVAHAIMRGVRRSDLVARYGGEEMVLVMPESSLNAARKRMEAIREAVASEPLQVPKRSDTVRVTVSAGVAVWPTDGEDPDDLLHTADARLFHAKALGRNRVVSSSIASASV